MTFQPLRAWLLHTYSDIKNPVIPAEFQICRLKASLERNQLSSNRSTLDHFILEQRSLYLYWTLTCFLSATEKKTPSPYIFLYNLKYIIS